MIGPRPTQREINERRERSYRNALRSVNDIARESLAGNAERRTKALMSIDRVSATALREGL